MMIGIRGPLVDGDHCKFERFAKRKTNSTPFLCLAFALILGRGTLYPIVLAAGLGEPERRGSFFFRYDGRFFSRYFRKPPIYSRPFPDPGRLAALAS